MTKITFAVNFQQSFLRGVDCPQPPKVTIDVDPASLTQQQRDAIAPRLRDNGEVHARSESDYLYFCQNLVTAAEPTLVGLLDAIAREDEASLTYATRKAVTAARKEKEDYDDSMLKFSQPEIQTIDRFVVLHNDGTTVESMIAPSYVGIIASLKFTYTRTYQPYLHCDAVREMDMVVRQKESLEAMTQRDHDHWYAQAQADIIAQHWQPRVEWIRAHGSVRLQRLLEEHIECESVYQKERAAYEAAQFDALIAEHRPGWTRISKERLRFEVANVSSRTLALLDAGRSVAPTCVLAKSTIDGKYVVAENFAGEWIYWPRD